MANPRFVVDDVSIAELFGTATNRFRVPQYQRRYSWDYQQVDQLWTDILEASESGEEDYFLGALVLSKTDDDAVETIDGQQRLATLTILLSVLRDHLVQHKREDVANKLHDYILRPDLRGTRTPVVTLGPADADDFHNYVQLPLTDPDREAPGIRRPAGRRGRPQKNYVRNAYDLLSRRIEEKINGQSEEEAIENLISIASFVTRKVTLISTLVTSDDQAYIIFETLNDRGLDLSIADLLKNHLFSLAAKRVSGELDSVTVLWQQLATTLEGVSIPRFLRHYWLSHYRVVTQRKLYGTIKAYLVSSKKNPRTFLDELISDAQIYVQLVSPKQGDPQALTLRDLALMGITQHLPLLMAASRVVPKEFSKVVGLVESLTMRYSIVGNLNPNRLERSYSEWAIQLRNNRSLEGLQDKAKMLLAQAPDFVDGFQALTDSPIAHVRYILRKLEEHKTSKELTIAWGRVDVEHILPQTPSKEWIATTGLPPQDIGQLSARLGNLTLLSKPLNKAASNRSFGEKCESHYKKSEIHITRELMTDFNEWNEDTIEQRQQRFAKLANEIWQI
ncbi:MAG: hypothetical protein HW388_378 [Dehalococcoidia bacterium]|nr:hypothetical protein [Dehalococcoidia bacterium]